jgi:hypothetical protein
MKKVVLSNSYKILSCLFSLLLLLLLLLLLHEQLKQSKVDLLLFLYRFILAAGKQVLPYACDIKETCFSMFSSDKYSDVRCATFPILIKILELTSGDIQAAEKLALGKLTNDYFVALSNQSKLNSKR